MSKQILVQCAADEYNAATEFSITIPKKKFFIRPKSKPIPTVTFGSEIDRLVSEWYAEKGLGPVPPEDLVGAQIDAANAEEDVRVEALRAKAEEEVPSVVPSYGTPEFWAYHRAKKAAENKKRADEGLPPLPTKKELEAAKIQRAAERATAKAAKEKAAAAKAALKALTGQVQGMKIQ